MNFTGSAVTLFRWSKQI